jgi:Glycosyl transferases group 1
VNAALPRKATLRINVCARGSDWLFEDLKRQFAQQEIEGVQVVTSEVPEPGCDAWIMIRTSEVGTSPDLAHTVVCLHDVYEHDGMYRPGGHRAGVADAAAIVLSHPDQRRILREAGISLESKTILERPLGALRAFTVRTLQPEEFTVGWVGRSHWRKRPEWLSEVMRHFPGASSRLKIVLIGKELEALQTQLRELGVSTEHYPRSSYPISTYPGLYQRLDCLLITSCTEAGPLTLFEALATGVPVVSTPVGWALHFGQRHPDYVRVGSTPAELAAHLTAIEASRARLFHERFEIARLVEDHRLDTWFRSVLNLAVTVAIRRT